MSRAHVTDTNSIQLAPAAGAGIGKLVADELLKDPEFIPLMKAAFLGALRAEIHFYDRESKSWESRPDERIRLQAVMGCLAHMEGEPVKRIIHQHLGGQGEVNPLAALEASPALRDAARRMLEKSEFKTRKQRKVEPADVDAVEV